MNGDLVRGGSGRAPRPTLAGVAGSVVPADAGPVARWAGPIGLAAFAAFVVVGLATRISDAPVPTSVGTFVALGAAVPLFLFRPRLPLGLALLATAGVVVIGAPPGDVSWFAVVVVGGWVAMAGGIRVGILYWVVTLLLFGGEWLIDVRDAGWSSWTAGVTVTVLGASLVRHQLELVERLRVAQAGLVERSRAEERNRIARELHDVIAHSLTVSLLHVTSARLAVEHDPADAARSLAEAERLGRQTLDEVRVTMGMLRPRPGEAVVAPVPGAGQVPDLVDQVRNAGADVSLTVDGKVGGLAATTGSAVYRIVQEALTNAARHAPGTPVRVRLAVDGGSVEVDVDSGGSPGNGSGQGLSSMRERAEAVGGCCTAGPGGGGWLVHASLPLAPAPEVR